jgi:O-antigen ligase
MKTHISNQIQSKFGQFLLLFWGISLGLPDIAYNISDIINVRLDDLLVGVMFIVLLFSRDKISYTPAQRTYLMIFISLVIYAVVSSYIHSLKGSDPYLYRIAQLLGVTMAFFVIPHFIKDTQSLKILIVGMIIGGIICLVSQANILFLDISTASKYQQIKAGISPQTWNANTLGTFCVIWFVMAAWGIESVSRLRSIRLTFMVAAIIFAAVPFIGFQRTAGMAIIILLTILLIFRANFKFTLIMTTIIAISFYFIATSIYPEIYEQAIYNLSPTQGASFEDRLFLWRAAFYGLTENPFGVGYGYEHDYFLSAVGGGMAHNVFLSAYLELGIIGGSIYLLSFIFWPFLFIHIIRNNALMSISANYMFSLSIALIFLGFGMPGFYFEKPGIIFAIWFGVMGLMQRNHKNMYKPKTSKILFFGELSHEVTGSKRQPLISQG